MNTDNLRYKIIKELERIDDTFIPAYYERRADAILALPEMQELLKENAILKEKIKFVEQMQEEITRLKDENEQLQVQLAGCGVAALCNTRESMGRQLCNKDAYGYSSSYQEVINVVKREIDLREERDRLKAELAEVREKLNSKYEEIIMRDKSWQQDYNCFAKKLKEAEQQAEQNYSKGYRDGLREFNE